ncbi:hypothetical protein RBU49_03805 [Clostridium sp. MB40-C1]|uniref:hypothetical protein n=1 Tax=Clostridium sp. MB40-C1 TaxID=3070996 RepID=UPI0027DFE63F|nr:hypothetical protein [Clostridium sp. MB40-C1]WMJ81393.1 hypothetical protein RBU49_03805 [Clostridium sp. MB40-C1]
MLRKNLFLNIRGNNVMNVRCEKLDKKNYIPYEEDKRNHEPYIQRDIIKNFEELKIKVKNRKLYIMLEGEEIHVKLLKLPKVYNEKLENMIENEMIYLYGTKANEIYYDYSVLKENKNDLDVLVFCVNCELLSNMKSYNKFKNSIKRVSLVQMHFIEYLKRYILENKYILILEYYNNIYFTAIYKDKIIANKVVKSSENDYDSLVNGVNFIKDRISIINVKIDNIYTCNINNYRFNQYLSEIKDVKYKNLGELKENRVIECFVKDRR